MRNMSQDDDQNNAAPFKLAVIARIKNGALWEAAKKLGSQTALAEHLGVNQSNLGRWINMREKPPITSPRWPEIERKLFALTGKTTEELFPHLLQTPAFLDIPKTLEATKEIEVRALAHSVEHRLLLPSPEKEFDLVELKQLLQKSLCTLGKSQRTVLSLRYGLDGEGPLNLPETAARLRLSKERVRQIEIRAISKLQHPARAKILEDFLEV